MRVILEPGDKPEVRDLIKTLQKCGVEFEIVEETEKRIHRCFTDKELKEAVLEVMPCFSVKSQWVAIYRVLVDYYDFPAKLTSFCQRVKLIMKGVDCNFSCDYQSIQKTLASKRILQKSYSEWVVYAVKDGERFFPRQKMIADKLLELLGGV